MMKAPALFFSCLCSMFWGPSGTNRGQQTEINTSNSTYCSRCLTIEHQLCLCGMALTCTRSSSTPWRSCSSCFTLSSYSALMRLCSRASRVLQKATACTLGITEGYSMRTQMAQGGFNAARRPQNGTIRRQKVVECGRRPQQAQSDGRRCFKFGRRRSRRCSMCLGHPAATPKPDTQAVVGAGMQLHDSKRVCCTTWHRQLHIVDCCTRHVLFRTVLSKNDLAMTLGFCNAMRWRGMPYQNARSVQTGQVNHCKKLITTATVYDACTITAKTGNAYIIRVMQALIFNTVTWVDYM